MLVLLPCVYLDGEVRLRLSWLPEADRTQQGEALPRLGSGLRRCFLLCGILLGLRAILLGLCV